MSIAWKGFFAHSILSKIEWKGVVESHWISTGAALGGRLTWIDWLASRVRDKPDSASRFTDTGCRMEEERVYVRWWVAHQLGIPAQTRGVLTPLRGWEVGIFQLFSLATWLVMSNGRAFWQLEVWRDARGCRALATYLSTTTNRRSALRFGKPFHIVGKPQSSR
jgi:hypothetical protein